jgi:hypothetical protein
MHDTMYITTWQILFAHANNPKQKYSILVFHNIHSLSYMLPLLVTVLILLFFYSSIKRVTYMAFTPKEPTKEKPRTRKTTMSIIQKKMTEK